MANPGPLGKWPLTHIHSVPGSRKRRRPKRTCLNNVTKRTERLEKDNWEQRKTELTGKVWSTVWSSLRQRMTEDKTRQEKNNEAVAVQLFQLQKSTSIGTSFIPKSEARFEAFHRQNTTQPSPTPVWRHPFSASPRRVSPAISLPPPPLPSPSPPSPLTPHLPPSSREKNVNVRNNASYLWHYWSKILTVY